jgi:DNA-binding NarL/FixJ family response regulator
MEVATPTVRAPGPVVPPNGGAPPGTLPAAAPRHRLRKVAAMMAVFHKYSSRQPPPVLRQRQLVADLCRLVGAHLGQPMGSRGRPGMAMPAAFALDDLGLSARMRQTLQGLLAGEAEKQIAYRLRLSPHTVHVYVKGLYRHFGVSSRGELLARFVRAADPAN